MNENTLSKEEMKSEAIRRLKALRVLPEVVVRFDKSGSLYVSERQNKMFPATLFWATNYEGLMKEVRAFEEKFNALVYHITLTHTEFGALFSFLYIPSSRDDLILDKEDFRQGYAMSYVVNAGECYDPDEPMRECEHDIGSIMIRPAMGGVERVA